MLLVKNNKIVTVLIFWIYNYSIAQVQIAICIGKNYNFGENVVASQKSNTGINFDVDYENESTLTPSLSITFSEIPLDFSAQIIKNQGDFKTNVYNKSTSFRLGLEKELKTSYKYKFSGKFGFGITSLYNPSVWIEGTNEGFGFNTSYIEKSTKSFGFLDLSGKIERKMSNNWIFLFALGTQYYPKNNSVSVITRIYEQNIEINSKFIKTRPYINVGLKYSF